MGRTFKVPLVLAPQPNGGYTVTSPILPEMVTEGDTLEEAIHNVKDALDAAIEIYEDLKKPLPGRRAEEQSRGDRGGGEPAAANPAAHFFVGDPTTSAIEPMGRIRSTSFAHRALPGLRVTLAAGGPCGAHGADGWDSWDERLTCSSF
ncbi:MAG: type II toxin-antitoxin system HicB family antitoxin [Candidatus Methylomirabilales bacterium]